MWNGNGNFGAVYVGNLFPALPILDCQPAIRETLSSDAMETSIPDAWISSEETPD